MLAPGKYPLPVLISPKHARWLFVKPEFAV
jgi:hypothetical protein